MFLAGPEAEPLGLDRVKDLAVEEEVVLRRPLAPRDQGVDLDRGSAVEYAHLEKPEILYLKLGGRSQLGIIIDLNQADMDSCVSEL